RGIDAGAGSVQAEFEGGEGRAIADALSGELVDGDGSRIEVVAHSPLYVPTGQPDRHLWPMPVAADRVLVPEILEEKEVTLESGKRLEMLRDFVVIALA